MSERDTVIWQETPYTVPLAVLTVVLVVSAFYVWWHRKVPWAKTGTLLVLAGAVWMLGYTLELASVPLAAKIFWAKVQYVGIVIVPPGSLAFVLQYTGHQKWLKSAVLLSGIISFVTLLLVITNEAHGLIWARVWNRVVPGAFGGYWDSDKKFGLGYSVFAAQSLIIALVAVSLLAHMLVRSVHLYRWQTIALLFAVFIFLLGATVEVFNDSPPDLIVLGFAIACLIVAWCLARLRRGDVRSVSYTAIFRSMNDGVVVLDDHNTVIDLNPAALRLVDLVASEEIVGQTVERVWPSLAVPAEDEMEEEMMLERDGRWLVYSVVASSVLDWRKRLVSRVVTLHDVTERKRAEQEIARHLTRTRVLREVMLTAASTLEFDQVLERTIKALWEMLGVEFIGFVRPAEDGDGLELYPARVRFDLRMGNLRIPLDGSVCGHVFQTGESMVIGDVSQVPYYHEGHPQVRSELVIPVRAAGEVIGVLNLESRHLNAFDEEEMAFYTAIAGQLGIALENARLYKEVYRYAGELAHAVTELRDLDRLKNEFIQGVSHELRAPLALIRGYAELLHSGELGELSPLQQGPVEIITRRARMMGNMVEDIAMLLTAKARVLIREPLAVDELVRASTEDFHLTADQASLTLSAEIASGLPCIDGAPVYLRRLLDNLVGNAIKFTPAGGSITVRVYQEGEWVVLQVADTGIGISTEEQERIFERFYQADGSGGRYRGFGLGLTLVKEIVAAHQGTVTVESVIGEGSVFTVKLPVPEEGMDNGAEDGRPEEGWAG
jgi:PAS domain S-box-containing protein